MFEDNITRMTSVIDKSFPDGTRATRPAGGFVLWLALPDPLNSRAVFEQALKRGICVVPGELFSASGRYTNCLRLSAGHPWHPRIENALRTLGDITRSMLRNPH